MGRWEVEFGHHFEIWWRHLDDAAQEAVAGVVVALKAQGPALTRPYADAVKGSRHSNMRELRVQSKGRPLRVFYAFDPRRIAILLAGGDKSGLADKRFYGTFVPLADQLYDQHLQRIKRVERLHG